MEFSAFVSLEKRIDSFRFYYERYPNAMSVLDLELRRLLVGREVRMRRSLDHLGRFNWKRYALRSFLSICSKIELFRNYKTRIIVSLGRFDEVKLFLSEKAACHGVSVHSAEWESGHGTRRLFSLAHIPVFAAALVGSKQAAYFKKIRTDGLLKFLHNESAMRKFDNLIELEIRNFSILLRRLDIRAVVSTEDYSASARVVCAAAKLVDIPYIVLAHGYVRDSALVSIAPVNGDALVVWTAQQMHDITKVLNPVQRDKVKYFGFPKYFKDAEPYSSGVAKQAVLFCVEELFSGANAALVLNAVKQVKNAGFELRIRAHPKERDTQEYRRWMSRNGLLDCSSPLMEAFSRVQVVVGMNSSVLIEAMHFGLPSFQLEELKKYDLERVESVSIDDLSDILIGSSYCMHGIDNRADGAEFTRSLWTLISL